MIDFVKFRVQVNRVEFDKNDLLDFKECYSKKTGFIERKSRAVYNGLKFDLYDNSLLIVSGSIHKYFNFLHTIKAPNQISPEDIQKGFNGNLYDYNQIKFTLNHIAESFKLNLNECKILNIEIGLNLSHSYNTTQILSGLMLHKGKQFNKPLANTYREAVHQRYYFKIYDKSLQYGLTENIIRVELKYKKMIDLNSIEVHTLYDLLNKSKLTTMLSLLRAEFDKTLIYDYTIDKTRLNAKELIKIKDYSNAIFWDNIKSNRRNKPKRNLDTLIYQYSQNIQSNLSESIQTTANELIKNRVIFNPVLKRIKV